MARLSSAKTLVRVKGLADGNCDAHPAGAMFSTDIPVLHLVNRFWIGGAERQFVERLRRHPAGFRAVVGCLEASGPLLEAVRAARARARGLFRSTAR